MLRRFVLFLAAAVLLLAGTVAGQPPARRVFVSVVDRTGAPVPDLTAADVRVLEEGVDRTVTRVAPGTEPMRIIVLADASSTVGRDLSRVRAALSAFFDALPGGHEVALVSTGRHGRVRVAPTSDRQPLQAAAAAFGLEGGQNSLTSMLVDVYDRLVADSPAWPVLVVLTTDGGELPSPQPFESYNAFIQGFAARAGSAHAVVLARRGSGPLSAVLDHLTKSVRGTFESSPDPNSLADRMRAVADRIAADHRAMSASYEVEYASEAADSPRGVRVLVLRDGAEVRVSARRPFQPF
jgi:hypothetical protein